MKSATIACLLMISMASCGLMKKRGNQPAHRHDAPATRPMPTTEFQAFPVDRADGFYEVVAHTGPYPFTDVVLAEHPVVSKHEVKKAKADVDEYQHYPVVDIELTKEGAGNFERATEQNIGKPMAIVIGGKVISMPVVQQKIPGGKIRISGNFSMAEVKEMAKRF